MSVAKHIHNKIHSGDLNMVIFKFRSLSLSDRLSLLADYHKGETGYMSDNVLITLSEYRGYKA